MKNFVLKDNIRHKEYSFPKTLLSFNFQNETYAEGKILLMDGKPVEFDYQPINNGYSIKVLADLPYMGEHIFTWENGTCSFSSLDNDNGMFCVVNNEYGLFDVVLKNGIIFFYSLDTSLKIKASNISTINGVLESRFVKTIQFEGDREYTITVMLKKELDYLEVYEDIKGFKEDEAKLVIRWEKFSPSHRYSKDRGIEKIDDYIDEKGKFPFVINPFMPKTSWWDQRYVCYYERKNNFWSGILLHDLKNFNDGQYALWGSRNGLAFHLYEDRIEGTIVQGKRAFMHILCSDKELESIGSHYMRYYSIVSLNNVKDYILDWESDQKEFPKYFKIQEDTKWGGFYSEHVGKCVPEDMMNILDRDASIFTTPEFTHPVAYRAYRTSWAQTFDLTAKDLSDDDFKRVRAAMALICYTFTNENFYPIENLLAGHPNFLTDVIGTVAVFASLLGKKHPMFNKWLSYYEIALARNLKYHIRPAVDKWNSEGGRWTESIGGYMMCMLRCIVYDSHIVYKLNDGELPLLYPQLKPFVQFLIDIFTPENVDGRRLLGPHGAHSCTGSYGGELGHGYCLTIIELADMLKNYEPLYSEYLLHNFRSQNNIDRVLEISNIYGDTYRDNIVNNGGTIPELKSRKYTGFGYILRDHVNTDHEMQVILQQIDEGPNYRWGRAAQGGCGSIYYYANRHRYTDLAPEDVGDENRGDVQSCTNFGVLVGHEFKCVGKNDLTEPLMDFGFVKYARLNAGDYSFPYYKYRSVMMVENRYIAIYDAVADKKQFGRFSWTQNQHDAFPVLKNIKPGVEGHLDEAGKPIDVYDDYQSSYEPSRVMRFDGEGDFLTIASHLRNYGAEKLLVSIDKKEYGADVVFPQTVDKIFNDQSRIFIENSNFSFDGYVGYMTELQKEKRLVIFNGSFIKLGDIALRIPFDKKVRHGMSLIYDEEEINGRIVFESPGEVCITAPRLKKANVYLNGHIVDFEYKEGAYHFNVLEGVHDYSIGQSSAIAIPTIIRTVENNNSIIVEWSKAIGASSYCVALSEDNGTTYTVIAQVNEVEGEQKYKIRGLSKGKFHVKICGTNGNKQGQYSHPYPIYVTQDAPHEPEGLRIEKKDKAYLASWGQVLGVKTYRLYKVIDGKKVLVYEGTDRKVIVQAGEYYVTSVNGIDESVPSLIRSTNDERVNWDHHPEKSFIRDTRSHEHGYKGFDYINNPNKPILDY